MSIKVYTMSEVAEILNVHPRTVFNHVHNGTLKAVKVGRSWRISEDNLRAFVNGFVPKDAKAPEPAQTKSE